MKLKNLFNNVFGEVVEEEGLGNNVLNTDAASEVELEPESQQEEVKSLPQQDEVQPQPHPEEEPQPQPKKEKKEKPVETAKPEDRTMFELLRNDIRFQISEVLNVLMSLKLEMKAKDELLDKQEETIRRQSQTISKFQDDLLYKIQKPLIMEMVEIADNIRLILNDREILENKDFEALIDRVGKLEDWVAASLSNNSVYKTNISRWHDEAEGYNMTDGGEGTKGHETSEETRRKMSEAHKGYKPTPEAIAKTAAASRIAMQANPPLAKLTPEDVRQIRLLNDDGVKSKDIAEKFGVTYQCIRDIINGKRWSHVV